MLFGAYDFGGVTLRKLPWCLQVAMGWTNSHLYLYYAKDGCYGTPDSEGEKKLMDDSGVKLRSVLPKIGDRLVYEYDLGDSSTTM